MYFDPLSSWLVSLLSSGIVLADEKSRGTSALEYDQKRIKQYNTMLNGDIRNVKKKYGLMLPETALKQIKIHITATKKCFGFQYANGQIIIDLDNQEYIVELLQACERECRKYDNVEEYRKKAEWYRNKAAEAKRRKERYANELAATRIKEAKVKEQQQFESNAYVAIGCFLIFGFIVLLMCL